MLHVSQKLKSMSADISELPSSAFVQIYPDACDVGVRIVSEKTGVVTEWVVDAEERDREGDLVLNVLVPTATTLRKHSALAGWKFTIYND